MDPESVSPMDYQSNPMPQKAKKKRIRNWTAEDRALHREFEKSRREAFSESLMELTELLPTLKAEARPSKHAIVDASIAYHRAQQTRCLRAKQALQSMMNERDDLLRELNGLRALCQPGPCIPRQARSVDPAVLDMLAETKVSAPDLTGGRGSTDELPDIPQQAVSRAMSGSQPGETLSAVSQGPPVDPSAALQQPGLSQISDAQTLAILNNGISPINLSNWDWEEPSKVSRQMAFHPTIVDEGALLWNSPPEIPTATSPRGAESEYAATPLYLIDDAARFWTQHPGLMNATPPGDSVPFTSPIASAQWRPHPLILNTLSQEASQIARHQMHNSTNSFSSDPENLSISLREMVEIDSANPTATLCSATN